MPRDQLLLPIRIGTYSTALDPCLQIFIEHRYIREAPGPIWGFLYGWTLFLVIQIGAIAAVTVAFGKFLGVFFPMVSSKHWIWHAAHIPETHVGPIALGNIDVGLSMANLVAIVIARVLTFINICGVKLGAAIQDIFATAKSLALLALVVAGLTIGRNTLALNANFGPGWHQFWAGSTGVRPVQPGGVMVGVLTILAVVQVGSLFSSDAWNNVAFTAGEIEHPRRNLPLSLVLGTGFVQLVYVLANFAFYPRSHCISPAGTTPLTRGIQFAVEDRVATAVLQQILPRYGQHLMAGAILISTFGCANGMILAGARVFYGMSQGLSTRPPIASASSEKPQSSKPIQNQLIERPNAAYAEPSPQRRSV